MTSSLHRTKDRQIRRRHSPSKGGLLSRSFTKTPYIVDRAEGHCYILEDDRAIYDLSGGASVSYLGPGSNKKILAAARAQEDRVSYTASYSLTTRIAAKYADALLTTTNGVMKHAVFYSSGEYSAWLLSEISSQPLGSDAVEAALKLSVQYFKDVTDQPTRTLFISREQSYHGTTLQALSVGGHKTRRDTFEKILTQTQHVSPCNEYRGKKDGESNEEFVSRLKEELRRKFEELGRENVAAFIAEPVVGAVSYAPVPASLNIISICLSGLSWNYALVTQSWRY
jgi:adenosylmethionine-8-amino-7-oxononanoate aminotransferase